MASFREQFFPSNTEPSKLASLPEQTSPPGERDFFVSADQELPETPGKSFRFIYVTHTPEYAKEIAEATGDADVVAIESVGGSREDRLLMEVLASDLSLSAHDDQKHIEAMRYLAFNNVSKFLQDLIWHLRGSGKQIMLVDAADEDKILEEEQPLHQKQREFESAKYLRPLAETIMVFDALQNAWAEWIPKRDMLVARQLEEPLGDLLKQQSGTNMKIAVVQGAIHTGTAHESLRKSRRVEKISFVPELPSIFVGNIRLPKLVYSYEIEIIRRKRFLPNAPISEALLKRGILESYFDDILELPFNDALNTYFIRKIIDDIDDGELTEMLTLLGEQTRGAAHEAHKEFVAEHGARLAAAAEFDPEVVRNMEETVVLHAGTEAAAQFLSNSLNVRFQTQEVATMPQLLAFFAELEERKRKKNSVV